MERRNGAQHGPCLAFLHGVDRQPRRLVDGQPTGSPGEHDQPAATASRREQDPLLDRNALLLARPERPHLDPTRGRQGQPLVPERQPAAVQADTAPGQQPAHLGTCNPQSAGQKSVQPQACLGGLDPQSSSLADLRLRSPTLDHVPSVAGGRGPTWGKRRPGRCPTRSLDNHWGHR